MEQTTDIVTTTTFDKLLAPKRNHRKRFDDIEGLAASIKQDGQLQNLVVRRERKSFRILAGERRYRAFKMLIEAGDLVPDSPIQISIRANRGIDAERVALIENIQRKQLDPIDEAEGFHTLLCDGMSFDDVAEKVGVSAMTVRRRIALASLCDEAKEAVRAGDVSLSEAQALTLGSHDQQRKLLEHVGTWNFDTRSIRHALTDRKPTQAVAIFDLEQYTGTYTRDLFADETETYFDDAEQFVALQRAAFEAKADGYREVGKEVVIVGNDDYSTWHDYYDGGKRQTNTVLMRLRSDGRVEVRENVVRHERRAAVVAATSAGEAKPKPEYSAAFLDFVGAIRTTVVMQALIADRRKLLEVAVFQIITNYQHRANGVEQHRAIAELRVRDPEHPALVYLDATAAHHVQPFVERGLKTLGYEDRPIEQLIHIRSDMSDDGAALYEVIKGLDDAELESLHGLLVAVTFGQTMIGRLDDGAGAFNQAAQNLGVDVRETWQPGEAFLKGYRADRLKDIAVECGFAAQRSAVDSYRKGDLVAALAEWFREAASTTEPSERQQFAKSWTDKALLFPAVAPGEVQPSCDAFPEEDAMLNAA